jgi:hypothetical protein
MTFRTIPLEYLEKGSTGYVSDCTGVVSLFCGSGGRIVPGTKIKKISRDFNFGNIPDERGVYYLYLVTYPKTIEDENDMLWILHNEKDEGLLRYVLLCENKEDCLNQDDAKTSW